MLKEFDSSLVLDHLEEKMFVKDLKSRYLYANEAYLKLLDQDLNSIIGKNDYDFFPQGLASKYIADDLKVITQEKEIDLEENLEIDGITRVTQTIKKPFYVDKKLVGVFGRFFDTTKDHKQKEDYLKLKRGLNHVQELANIGHWELDLSDNSIEWSDQVYIIFGYEPREINVDYEFFLKHLPSDDAKILNEVYLSSLENKEGYYIVHKIIKKNGEIAYVEERCEHEYDEDGHAIKSVGTVHDVTIPTLAQKELVLASKVFSNMSDGVTITDADTNILKTNQAFSAITGYSFEDVEGKTPKILKSGVHKKSFYEDMWNDLITKGQWHGEIVNRKKDGSRYIAEHDIIVLYDDVGNISNYISITNDITKRKEQEKLINNLAYYDFLTNLPNRILFQERVIDKISSMKRKKKKLAVIFVDLDNFKNVNDTLGHLVGDDFLISVADTLKSLLRDNDTLARLGGDEFGILLEDIDDDREIVYILDRIVENFKDPIVLSDIEFYTGVSLGVSIYPDDALSYEDLIKASDTAMYQVKESGKNGYKFYNSSMNDKITKRVSLENDLRKSVDKNEMFVEYQPKINLETKKIYGMEALVRWNHPSLGLIPPDNFISIAEDTKQINEIGLWVMKQAISDTKQMHKLGQELIVSINVSSIQLEKVSFVEDVCLIVDEIGLEKEYIELEITESHLMQNIEKALLVLNELSAKGFKFSIDDFGTGYSSLSYLKKLPVQTIKIDRSFVLDIDKDEEDKSIVATVIAMAKSLGKDIIAEGSETKEHIDALRALECTKVQGFYYSKPLSFENFKKYVLEF